MDAATKRAIEALTRELQRTQADLATVKRASRRPQLGFSSIESGSLDVVDPETGVVRLRLGYQPDGSVGVIPEGGDPPPAPTAPVVAAAPVGLMVQWDGQLAHGLALPADFDHVSVHVSEQSGFTPTAVTFQGTITRAGGLFPVVPLEVGTTYYVMLVPVGTGGVEGAPSVEASGVPDPVGGVPGPGSITETELADDAVTTPKLRALAVEAYHIVAQAIEAGHIRAQAIEAAHLAAEIVLASRIIAGNPAADRVEIDADGLRGYDADNALVFAIQDGSATFSGTVTGSEISGSRFTMGTAPVTGVIESTGSTVTQRVQSGNRQAQLVANATQANFIAMSDGSSPSSPLAGFAAEDDSVSFVLDSSRASADGLPSVTGSAFPASAQLVLWSKRNDTGEPRQTFYATAGEAGGVWTAATGSDIRVRAVAGWAEMAATPAASTVGSPAAGPGIIYAFRRSPSDAPTLSFQSPLTTSGPGADRRSIIHVEGTTTDRPHTIINSAARRHYLQGELVSGSTDTTTDGVVELAPTHSLHAPRHHAVRTDLLATPTALSTGDFVDFTAAQMPPQAFKTGWSGRVRVIIQMCGINHRTSASTIAMGFRLSGAGTVPAGLSRAAMSRSAGTTVTSGRPAFQVVDLDLIGTAEYTLTPMWRISGGGHAWGDMHSFDFSYQNSIIIEPLM